jgi:hypothetical protein
MSLNNRTSSASHGIPTTGNGHADFLTDTKRSSSLAIMTAASVEIVIGRERLLATPLTLADYGEIDQAVLAGRPDPMQRALALCAGLSESLQRALLATAFDELIHGWPVTAHEVALWMSSREGIAHTLWLAIRSHQPQLTLADCRELLLGEAQWRQAIRALDKIHGLPLGKSQGKLLRRARRPKPTTSKRAASPGAKCFAG